MRRVAFFGDDAGRLDSVFDDARREHLNQIAQVHPRIVTSESFDSEAPNLSEVEAIFGTWGLPRLDSEQLARLPRLEALFYAAGTVKPFARPFHDHGIRIISSWAANAIPVAEFTLAQILLSCKGYFRNRHDYMTSHGHGGSFSGRGAYGETVALIGAGMVGRTLIGLLTPINLNIVVVDPYMSEEDAHRLGVTLADVTTAFETAYVVSNHVPDTDATRRMITGDLIRRMRPDATFINTARGATVAEEELESALRDRPDLTALLDVTWPEPPVVESWMFRTSNVHLTSHIAGSKGDELRRLADFAIEEFESWDSGRPLRFEITAEMLGRLA